MAQETAAGRLIIEAGTQVRILPIDQDDDGLGDYEVRAAGTLEIRGTAAEPVIFSIEGPPGRPGGLRLAPNLLPHGCPP